MMSRDAKSALSKTIRSPREHLLDDLHKAVQSHYQMGVARVSDVEFRRTAQRIDAGSRTGWPSRFASRDGVEARIDQRADATRLLRCARGANVLDEHVVPDDSSKARTSASGSLMGVVHERTMLLYRCAAE